MSMASSKSNTPATPKPEEDTPPSSAPSQGDDYDDQSNEQKELSPADENPATDIDNDGEVDGISATMQAEERRMAEESQKEQLKQDEEYRKQRTKDAEGGKDALDTKFKALDYLLSQSKLYSSIMLAQLQKQEQVEYDKDEKQKKREAKREDKAEKAAQESQRKETRHSTGRADKGSKQGEIKQDQKDLPTRGRGRPAREHKQSTGGQITDYLKTKGLGDKSENTATVQEALQEEAQAVAAPEEDGVQTAEIGIQNLKSARQPDLVTGGVMRKYQLEGLEWLTSLYENGLNGILADEMGLGKTIQTISFLAFLKDKGVHGPFLIAAPLSTTSNWVDEFRRWTPTIPVVLYHGSKDEREHIRQTQLKNPGSEAFPVICTSYEICMNDRKYLAGYGWKYIIIDEGHRIKNLNCRLIRELQSYQSANRLLITGTPLQNNLAELWSLLHFLMPEIFDKLESFESWFDFSALKEKGGHEQIFSEARKKSLVTSLHAILKPFLLRRVKADVEHSLPKKREYVLYAPLSLEQRELYQEILNGTSRSYLEERVIDILSRKQRGASKSKKGKGKASSSLKRKAGGSGISTPLKSAKTSRASTPGTNASSSARATREKKRRDYSELSDSKYFKQLEAGKNSSSPPSDAENGSADEQEQDIKLAKRLIAQKKLQNPVMQLRLCCNSPHNFYDAFLDHEEDFEVKPEDEDIPKNIGIDFSVLLCASGKMVLLDRLLSGLLRTEVGEEPHKILLFSQFKSQLDILSLYLTYHLNIPHCRLDGSIPAAERGESIRLFNQSPKHRVFLLSTRAGGQGINLAAADTVILFDSDWNPQQDLQAQDRAHRIGQRRNVIVYRLATRGTIEEVLLSKAEGKRRLEKLVIRKGGLRGTGKSNSASRSRGRSSQEQRGRQSKSHKSVTNENDASASEDENEDQGEDADEDGNLEALRQILGKGDGEVIDLAGEDGLPNSTRLDGANLLSDEDLKLLTDRSDDAYERVEKGMDIDGAAFRAVETKKGKPGADGILDGL